MPVRATKRGVERTPLEGEYDVIICGASFAGLATARELSGSGARVLLLDRYEIGEKQTSACAAPTEWLENLGLTASIRQTFGDLVIHRARAYGGPRQTKTYRWHLPWTFSTFDYREICALLKAQSPDVPFETAKVDGRTGETVHTDRGDLTAPLIVDSLGWPRYLSESGQRVTPPNARVSRGLEVHPDGSDSDLELWLDPKYVKAGYSWNFPAGDELRVGVGSFDPHKHVKQPTVELASELGLPAERWQGNWIPHQMRKPTDGIVFFAGDSAGHCFPVTAEGIRPALYFGLACGRELRKVVEGRQTRGQALERYAAFCDEHKWAFDWLLRVQNLVGRVNALPLMDTALDLLDRQSFVDWSFSHYLDITPPSYVLEGPHGDRFVEPAAAAGSRAPAVAAA
jgi:flavin-dependent dehydrogenase